ncbi:MAG TPA: OB-fold domain-containing protein [Actinomycetota bacterium]|nr:OB-fold domain-containing protein [Actinomycetota bacterium]
MAGIARWGTAIPLWRLDRAMLGRAWDTPAMPGERTAAAGDQDSLTLGVEAALAATRGFDTGSIDFVAFATTTPPYAEKQTAATIAAVLDRHDVRTADFTGTLRAGTTAVRAALDAVRSGSARAALVVAADMRPSEPSTAMEQLFGDGAAAVVVTGGGVADVVGEASIAEEFTGPWRRTDDDYVRSFDGKSETEYGYARAIETAVSAALSNAGVSSGAVTRFAAYAPDPRTYVTTAKRIGIASAKDPLFSRAGNLGAAHALVSLCGALDEAAPGEHIVLAAPGEGADALVLAARDGVEAARPDRTLANELADKRILASYERYVRFRKLIPGDEADVPSSTIRTWRDRAQAFALYGVRCGACGQVQFPANRACIACSTLDKMEPVRLTPRGTVFTFTLDHLIAGEYLETPVPRAVVDMDGGGRMFLEVTDCEPNEVHVGMQVELTFRLMHEGADFKNYYWKARPARTEA